MLVLIVIVNKKWAYLKFYKLESFSFRFLPLNGHLNIKFPLTTEQEWHQNKDLLPKVVQLSHNIIP